MIMVSPYKLFEGDKNCFKLADNVALGNELREFFANPESDYLWKISTHRQTITHALRHTEYINLRFLDGLPQGVTTTESNQHMGVAWAAAAGIPVFKKALQFFSDTLKKSGASNVEFGRIFVSKLAGNQGVDLHVDEGKYFSHYDRFHFTVTSAPDNLFVIRDEHCILEQDSLYWVNNHVPHWLENKSSEGRINFIIDARLT